MSASDISDRLTGLLVEPLLALGLDLEAVDVTTAGKRRVLRVAVDRDNGVSMDDIAEATREVSTVLDETEAMGQQPYTLEVSSRGVDRPLTRPRHWRRNRGRLVTLKRHEGEPLTGRITHSDDETVTLDIDGAPTTLPYEALHQAKVQVEFTRHET